MKTLLTLFCFVACFGVAECILAAMSIDMGTQFIKVGLVKPGVPMEIVLNRESRRKTPNVLSIRNNERVFADNALGLAVRYPSTVYGNLMDLVAKHIDSPSVKLFQARFPHLKATKHANESTIVFPIGEESYTVETLLAMILSDVRSVTEAYAEQTVRDAVISVPVYFTQAERLAIERAAAIARLNLLQLINEGTAVALNYGVFRRKEVTEKPQRLLIYDMGAGKTVTTVVEFKLAKEKYGKEPKATVLGVGYDRTLGGLEITLRLRDHLVKKFRENYKTQKDVTTNERAMAKMFKEAERVKQVLSANPEHFAQIESVHEDKDMKIKVTRDELNGLFEDLVPRMSTPIDQALKVAELKMDDIDAVVLMGAGTRVPKVQEVLQKAIGTKEIGRFLNTDESVAMGGLFQAAHLSKGFKVLPFNVEDLVIFPVQVNFISKQTQENGEIIEKPITRQIFQYKTHYPSSKKTVSFTSYTEDFSFELNYGDLKAFTELQKKEMDILISHLATVSVAGVGKALEDKMDPEHTEFKGIKIAFRLDYSGIVRIDKAEAVIQKKSQGVVESLSAESKKGRYGFMSTITNTISGFFSGTKEEGEPQDEKAEEKKDDVATDSEEKTTEEQPKEEETKTPEEKTSQEKTEEKTTTAEGAEESNTKKEAKDGEDKKSDDDTANEAKKNETKKEEKKVPEIVKVVLKTSADYTKTAYLLGDAEIESYKQILLDFESAEKDRAERAATENELEAFAFESTLLPDEEDFKKFSSDEERKKLVDEAIRIRAWMEDETSPSTTTEEFRKELDLLKDLVKPVKTRITESVARPTAVGNLLQMLNSSQVFLTMGGAADDEKALFNQTDVEAFGKKLEKLQTWLDEKTVEQEAKQLWEKPAFTAVDVEIKIRSLDRELKTFMRKMRVKTLPKDEKKTEKDKKSTNDTKKEEKTTSADDKKTDEAATDKKVVEDAEAEKKETNTEESTTEKPVKEEKVDNDNEEKVEL